MNWYQAFLLLKHQDSPRTPTACARCGVGLEEFKENPTVSCEEYKEKLEDQARRLRAMDKPQHHPYHGL